MKNNQQDEKNADGNKSTEHDKDARGRGNSTRKSIHAKENEPEAEEGDDEKRDSENED